jgi:hypothetical protein
VGLADEIVMNEQELAQAETEWWGKAFGFNHLWPF